MDSILNALYSLHLPFLVFGQLANKGDKAKCDNSFGYCPNEVIYLIKNTLEKLEKTTRIDEYKLLILKNVSCN